MAFQTAYAMSWIPANAGGTFERQDRSYRSATAPAELDEVIGVIRINHGVLAI